MKPAAIQLIPSTPGEVLHLLETLQRHNVTCDLELQAEGKRDPLMSLPQSPLQVEYLESSEGDSIVVYLGDAELDFDLETHEFYKLVTGSRITIGIAGLNTFAWFDSSVLTPKVLNVARSYALIEEPEASPIELIIAEGTEANHEALQAMIEHIADGMNIVSMKYNGTNLIATLEEASTND